MAPESGSTRGETASDMHSYSTSCQGRSADVLEVWQRAYMDFDVQTVPALQIIEPPHDAGRVVETPFGAQDKVYPHTPARREDARATFHCRSTPPPEREIEARERLFCSNYYRVPPTVELVPRTLRYGRQLLACPRNRDSGLLATVREPFTREDQARGCNLWVRRWE